MKLLEVYDHVGTRMHWHTLNYQIKGSPIALGNWLSKISSGQQFMCVCV